MPDPQSNLTRAWAALREKTEQKNDLMSDLISPNYIDLKKEMQQRSKWILFVAIVQSHKGFDINITHFFFFVKLPCFTVTDHKQLSMQGSAKHLSEPVIN